MPWTNRKRTYTSRRGSSAGRTSYRRGNAFYSSARSAWGGPRARIARRSTYARRAGRSRSLMAPLAITRAREFMWGSLIVSTSAAGIVSGVTFNQPNNLGSTTGTAMSVVTQNFTLGAVAEFSLLDMPASFVSFVQQFENYKIDKVSKSHMPLYN